MDQRTQDALSRTSRLVNQQFFAGNADEGAIGLALPKLAIAIVADERNASSASAQTLIVTLSALIARMGIGVQVECPDVALVAPQPPLRGARLRSALVELGSDLIPGVPLAPQLERPPLITFVIGDTACRRSGALRLTGGDWDLAIEPAAAAASQPWRATLPFGALACAPTAAAEGLRAALPALAELIGIELEAGAHRLDTGQAIRLDLRDWFPGVIGARLDAVDAISGGAITSAALYVLLRVPGLTGALRVVEAEPLDLSNLNRYMLSRESLNGVAKIAMLEGFTRPGFEITGMRRRFENETLNLVGPLAQRVLVGVDHIPSRWLAQRHAPSWVGVGATQSLESMVSAHLPGEPCSGCLHPREPEVDETVPTISFVSFWAGLLLALELLSEAGGARADDQALLCWPFGWDGPHLMRLPVAAQAHCPVRCPASRRSAA